MATTYKIIRFYYGDRRRTTIKSNVTLEEAQKHCNDPRTRKEGEYFDGFTQEHALYSIAIDNPAGM